MDTTESNIGDLVEYIAMTLARKPDDVRVETYLYGEEIEVNLLVDQEDMGRIIGRQGRVAHAIRALAKAAHVDPDLHVLLNIDCWQEIGDGKSPSERQAEADGEQIPEDT